MNAGAIIAAQQRQAVRAFRERGCTTPDTARPLEELSVRKNFAIKSLIRRGVLREVESDRYWLDDSAWEALSVQRRKFVTILLVLMAIFVVVSLLLDN